MNITPRGWLVLGAILILNSPEAWAQGSEQAVSLADHPRVPETLDMSDVYGKLRITGFGVGAFEYAGNTSHNSFSADKMALSAFEQVNASLYFFGQLTTALEGEEAAIEIDNLILSYTPAALPSLTLMGGKFDAPIGFERDDEPLNFQPSNSFNFEFARPVKYSGLLAIYTLSPVWDLTTYVVNGWDLDVDNNKAKTFGTRVGFSPAELSSLGLSFVLGFPQEDSSRRVRLLANLDYTFQPTLRWVVAGEVNLASEQGAAGDGGTAWWYGGQLTTYYQMKGPWAMALRYDVFRDRDGTRTDIAQTLQSLSLAPSFRLKQSQYGAYSTRGHTIVGIPQLEIRLEFRLNRSTARFFDDAGGTLSRWDTQTRLQAVVVF